MNKKFVLTLGVVRAGAIGKSIGSVAASQNPKIRAMGLMPCLSAALAVIRTQAAAPSFKVDAVVKEVNLRVMEERSCPEN